MFFHLYGLFYFISPAELVVDVNGVGYTIQISLHTYNQIKNLDKGKVYTYFHIREDAQILYGFSDFFEKEVFLHLISISGIGTNTARMMLSSSSPEELVKMIVHKNAQNLEKIKGIGKKTAERICLELSDKLEKITFSRKGSISYENVVTPKMQNENDALQALIALGVNKVQAEKALQKVVEKITDANADVQTLIKEILKII